MAILALEHSDDTGIDRLGESLREHGHRVRIVNLHDDEPLPTDLDDIDGVVVCGGPQSPLDASIGWLEDEMALLRTAHETGRPVVGICFGCQILARAMGGVVDELETGYELGWHEVSLTPAGREDPLHAGLAWSMPVVQWHRYHVTQLPPDARLLASSARCKVQTWALGLRTYGFQYHPEAYAKSLEIWAKQEPDALEEAGTTLSELNHATERHFHAFERLTDRLFHQIALLLMPVDRRYQGLVKDLHH